MNPRKIRRRAAWASSLVMLAMLATASAEATGPTLSPFRPPGTENTETVQIDTPDKAGRPVDIRTVDLALRGSGFSTDPAKRVTIIVNGHSVPVIWDDCLGGEFKNKSDPVKSAAELTHGQVVSPDHIELCRVAVEGSPFTVAVQQDDGETSAVEYRIYSPTWPVAVAAAAIALVLALLVLMLVKIFKRNQKETKYNVLKILFLDNETDTYSLSKFQFYLWTAASIFGYAYLAISKMIVQGGQWPDIPETLPAIIAVGAGTAIGAQFVTNVRGPKGAGAEEPSLGDLVTSGGVAAPERVQMLVWTIIGVVGFCLAVVKHRPGLIQELDGVPTGLMYMMGLSSAGYLGGKLARKPGPIINELSITPAESDEDVAGEAARPPASVPIVSLPIAQAKSAQAALATPSTANGLKAVQALTKAISAAEAIKTVADGTSAVAVIAQLRDDAAAAADLAAREFAVAPPTDDAARVSAEAAQQAAAAVHDLADKVTEALGNAAVPAAPKFTRVIELRGRNLSKQALFEIDGAELPFRMLRRDAEGHQLPEVVVRESDDPTVTLGQVLRLSIDPDTLEDPDLKRYKKWFGQSSTVRKTFSLISPDGQRADLSFTIPPATAQSATQTS